MKPEGTILCPICAGSTSPAFMAGEHRMYRCSVCRTAFVSPQPSDEYLSRFYDTYHRADQDGGLYDAVESRMQQDFPTKVKLVKSALAGKAGRILDVGCGKGYFVKECMDNGLTAEGIDLSESGVRFAQQKLGVKASCGPLSQLKTELGCFDVVTFWATIEHLPDPMAMLRDIRVVLKPGGKLLLDTGVGDDWLDRTVPGCVQWYDPPQHLFVFSANGMQRAVEQAGFRLIAMDSSFERSRLRSYVKAVRNGGMAVMLRLAAELGRMKQGGFATTRFPIGNLMSVCAERVD